jgi:hypothetical protein
VELVTGEFFLRWKERHPELPSAKEYLGEGVYWRDRGKRLVYRTLYDAMPSKRCEKPLTEDQAVALRDAIWEVDGPRWAG